MMFLMHKVKVDSVKIEAVNPPIRTGTRGLIQYL